MHSLRSCYNILNMKQNANLIMDCLSCTSTPSDKSSGFLCLSNICVFGTNTFAIKGKYKRKSNNKLRPVNEFQIVCSQPNLQILRHLTTKNTKVLAALGGGLGVRFQLQPARSIAAQQSM